MKANEQQMVDLLKRTLNLLNDPNADGFQAGHLQGDIATLLDKMNEVPIVIGEYYGNQNYGDFIWQCPTTDKELTSWGQFDFDETGFYHKVYDESDKLIYIVKEA